MHIPAMACLNCILFTYKPALSGSILDRSSYCIIITFCGTLIFVDFVGQQKNELKCQPILIKYSSYNGSQRNPWNVYAQENVFNGRTTKFDALES